MIPKKQIRSFFLPLFFLSISLLGSPVFSQAWEQFGMNLNGEAASDRSGSSVSISADGLTVAIAAQGNDGFELVAGHVRIYRFINGEWMQLGEDIDGEAEADYSGSEVSLSDDGSIVAIGAEGNDDGGTDAGHVRVFQWDGDEWIQMGADIDGEHEYDQFGYSLDLSSDGSIVAVGAYGNDDFAPSAGHVRVFQFIAEEWVQMGQDIDGQLIGEWFGVSVDLDADGTIVTAGASHNNENEANTGEARVYQFISGEWVQMGTDIENDIANSYFGRNVTISADGQMLAVEGRGNTEFGAPFVSSQVKVFQFESGDWQQLGPIIIDTLPGNASNRSIDFSADGSTLAIGLEGNDEVSNNAGKARTYRFSSGEWIQFGTDIFGQFESDFFGSAVSLNADGTIMAVGAMENDESGIDAGQVKVFSIECPPPVFGIDSMTACGSFTWIDGNTYTSNNDTSTYQVVSSTGCDSIVTLNLTITNSTSGIDTQTACDSFTWIDGSTYTSDNGSAIFTISTPGCDSIVTLNLTINNSSNSIDTQVACDSFVWLDGNAYTSDNDTSSFVLTNSVGCDSVVTLNLTINTVDTMVFVSDFDLTANATNASFQWLDCDEGFAEISGETEQVFSPDSSGNYAVQITQNGCVDTSACVPFFYVNVDKFDAFANVHIFPNPTTGWVNINGGDLKVTSIRIFDFSGQIIFEKMGKNNPLHQVKLDFPNGIYFVEIGNFKSAKRYKLVKM